MPRTLSISEAFAEAAVFLASPSAVALGVLSATWSTHEAGLVELRLEAGRVVGKVVGS